MANSTMEADSGIGKIYVPSRTAFVSLRKTCVTCVVATCPLIFVSLLMDLTGRARGRVTETGVGQRLHGPGTITPCAKLAAAVDSSRRIKLRPMKIVWCRIPLSFQALMDAR